MHQIIGDINIGASLKTITLYYSMQSIIARRDKNVFSSIRKESNVVETAILKNDEGIKLNDKNVCDGLQLLLNIHDKVITGCFFDPQYRGIMEKMKYGNEGETRQIERSSLDQMNEVVIKSFINEIDRVLINSGHLFLWIDKFHLCEGTSEWFKNTSLHVVDLITWDKGKIGMGYRTRRKSEYLLVLQKEPIRAKGVWCKHDIPDVWTEKITGKIHPHQKPLHLQKSLISAISSKSDYILDPCAGSYSILTACKEISRNFIGSDLENI